MPGSNNAAPKVKQRLVSTHITSISTLEQYTGPPRGSHRDGGGSTTLVPTASSMRTRCPDKASPPTQPSHVATSQRDPLDPGEGPSRSRRILGAPGDRRSSSSYKSDSSSSTEATSLNSDYGLARRDPEGSVDARISELQAMLDLQRFEHRKLSDISSLDKRAEETGEACMAGENELRIALDKPQTNMGNKWRSESADARGAHQHAIREHQRAWSKRERLFDQALKDHNLAGPEHLDQRLKELDDSIEKLEAQLQAVEALRYRTKSASPPSASSVSKGLKTPLSSARPRSRAGFEVTGAYSTEAGEDNANERKRNVTGDNRRKRRYKHALIRKSKSRRHRRVMHRAPKGIFHSILDKLRDLTDLQR